MAKDWPYLSMQWDGKYYFDKVLPFGLNWYDTYSIVLRMPLLDSANQLWYIKYIYQYLDDLSPLSSLVPNSADATFIASKPVAVLLKSKKAQQH